MYRIFLAVQTAELMEASATASRTFLRPQGEIGILPVNFLTL